MTGTFRNVISGWNNSLTIQLQVSEGWHVKIDYQTMTLSHPKGKQASKKRLLCELLELPQ
jgi:hypothetical protein